MIFRGRGSERHAEKSLVTRLTGCASRPFTLLLKNRVLHKSQIFHATEKVCYTNGVIAGDHSKYQGMTYDAHKNLPGMYFIIFINNIWSCLLRSPVVVDPLCYTEVFYTNPKSFTPPENSVLHKFREVCPETMVAVPEGLKPTRYTTSALTTSTICTSTS